MKILLATDGSESAKAATEFMLRLPLAADTEIRLLTVVDKEIYRSKKKYELNTEQRQLLDETKQFLLKGAEALLAESKARLTEAGWRATTQILSGHPSKQIVRAAKKLPADLVIVGSHGLTGIGRFLLGSVSDRVLAYAPCSVLIVKPRSSGAEAKTASATWATDTANQRLKMLLAYDDSPSAKLAVDFCTAFSLRENVEVNVITVLPLVKLYRQDVKQRLSWVWKEKKKLAKKALERLSDQAVWNTPHLAMELREAADVSQEILDEAARNNTDLIVLGDKGKGAVEKFLVGSVTARIAHHAPCSVLVVRRPIQRA